MNYMLNTNNLSYWTIQNFPYILTPINNFMLFTFNKGRNTTVSSANHTFCYVKSGSVMVDYKNLSDDEKSERITLTEGMLVEWSGRGFIEFSALEENSKVLVVSFKILGVIQSNRGEFENEKNNYTSPILLQSLSIEMPHTLMPNISSTEHLLLENMCVEIAKKRVGHLNKMQILISQLVVEIVRNNPKFPRYIDAIAITSDTDHNIPLVEGREVFIEDVEIWCNYPNEEDASCLRTMRASRYFISNNGNTQEKINYELLYDDEVKGIGRLYSGDKSMCYKVLLWADEGIKPLDVELYHKKWIYIRTRIKSNMVGDVGIALYTTKGHHWFGSSVMIQQADVWQEVLVPIMFVQSRNDTSQVVVNAIKYIHKNYNQKITLKMVADAIYVNPNYLSTIFSNENGMSFSSYVRNYRLTVAQKKLIETDESVEKIALAVGFYDVQHFSKIFKREYGVSPKNFRKMNKAK